MKQPIPLHPARNLALLGCLLALGCGLGRAQAPVAQRLDVYFGETTLLPDRRADRQLHCCARKHHQGRKVGCFPQPALHRRPRRRQRRRSPSRAGIAPCSTTWPSAPAPVRLYINLNESKRLTFPGPDRRQQPFAPGHCSRRSTRYQRQRSAGGSLQAGKTTLTVTPRARSTATSSPRLKIAGADVLEIQNDFSAKGYRNLTITFDKDQAIIGGTVPTQEELDDAVRIVKQFTDYVAGQGDARPGSRESEYTEQESIIINNIQRIANVKGLTVRVKFPMPTVVTTSTYTKSTGDYVEPPRPRRRRAGPSAAPGFSPPPIPTTSRTLAGGPLDPKPQENTTETVTTTEEHHAFLKRFFSMATCRMTWMRPRSFALPAPFALSLSIS